MIEACDGLRLDSFGPQSPPLYDVARPPPLSLVLRLESETMLPAWTVQRALSAQFYTHTHAYTTTGVSRPPAASIPVAQTLLDPNCSGPSIRALTSIVRFHDIFTDHIPGTDSDTASTYASALAGHSRDAVTVVASDSFNRSLRDN